MMSSGLSELVGIEFVDIMGIEGSSVFGNQYDDGNKN